VRSENECYIHEIGHVLEAMPVSNPYHNITIERYISKKFYSVIIDIGASKKSIIGYRQYLAYKNTIVDNTNINTI
jgi:hypothetical protein